ncbi:hypothetical protein ACHAXS_009199 [Conticribra weissflogii]
MKHTQVLLQFILFLVASLPRAASSPSIHTGEWDNDGKRELVIGGDTVSIDAYPYAVSLQDDVGHFCGGSLIARDVILTAAHCQRKGNYEVVIGRHDLYGTDGDEVYVKKEIPHPKYNWKDSSNDFMLIILGRPTNAVNAGILKLNTKKSIPYSDDKVVVMGWGDTVASDFILSLSSVLRAVELSTISNSDCRQSKGLHGGFYDSFEGSVKKNMLCAKDLNQDACQGDSGGPLVIRGQDPSGSDDIQVGVVSWGIGCASQVFPGVYSRISSAYKWIRSEVCLASNEPPTYMQCDNLEGELEVAKEKIMQENSGMIANDASGGGETGGWSILIEEEFLRGFGVFNKGGRDAVHYKIAKERIGVVRIQDGNGEASSIFSNKFILDEGYSMLKVCFSFYGIGMERVDSFCLDHSIDASSKWVEERCWFGRVDFPNKVWIDDVCVEFTVPTGADTISLRFRCHGDERRDDILIDKVTIHAFLGTSLGSEGAESKAMSFLEGSGDK